MKTEQSYGGSLSELCSLSGHSRQAYYKQRHSKERVPLQSELIIQQVKDYREIQPCIGGRKLLLLLHLFLQYHGIKMGRDAFFDLLGAYGLLIPKRRPYKPKTTFSSHWMRKYPNLIKKMTLNKSGQLWVSDITHIALCEDDGFLSLVTDAYSRKIVGFHLSDRLSAVGPVEALKMAVSGRSNNEKLTHHSDRGVQYCCDNYVEILKDNAIDISMTESGDPRDNAIAERVNGILKIELLEKRFTDITAARTSVAQAVNTYNYLRPHSSIDMLTPALAHSRTGTIKRRWKSNFKPKLKMEAIMSG
jgi:transposase InsO family protein